MSFLGFFGQAETFTSLTFVDCLLIPIAVTLARNGRQALEALQSPEGEHINLILTDVLMPEVGIDRPCEFTLAVTVWQVIVEFVPC